MVSRETAAPPAPDVVRGVFRSETWPAMVRYADLLATWGIERGLLGPREVPRLWERHLANCAVVGEAIGAGSSVADVGSGAGLPGLVLAIDRPDLSVTLIEPLLRRTTFLTEVVTELGLRNVEVHRGRADSLVGVRDFDVVTSRAVAGLDRLVGWSLPLVRPSGCVLAMKGSTAPAEIVDSRAAVRAVGGSDPELIVLGPAGLDPVHLVRVSWEPGRPVPLSSSRPGGSDRRGGRSTRAGVARGRRTAGSKASPRDRGEQGG
ncbi:16S rRNA (guanine(527)-N(7))-methyltransferase RsmG [Nocardioides sp. R-C-SC26]|uniref:16S rRNA (guanine(527)-N(7))-methyltransferase RsmG n=1 Tax=Nocardioides sp. R-C-SC26 TaxID=2870414 RepID=UPI0027E0E69A|nr:16S rRNA (guanine(527)-N(7))-methyltransferase RsmG [Nocardioides sp. R-C-SC26]